MHKKSMQKLSKCDMITCGFMSHLINNKSKHWHSRVNDCTFAYPDFSGKKHSYLTVLTKLANAKNGLRRSEIFLPKYELERHIQWNLNDTKISYGPRKVDVHRGRGCTTLERLLQIGFASYCDKRYHITTQGRIYLKLVDNLKA